MKDLKNNSLNEFYDCTFHNVLLGNFMVTKNPKDVIGTLLGSCVSACIRCTQTGIGGLNHFLLPCVRDNTQALSNEQAMRYGDYAMEILINTILRYGGNRHTLEAKLFGGANMYKTQSQKSVGTSNIKFVRDFIQTENIKLVAEDFGGNYGRKIYFHPFSGRVKLQKLNKNNEHDINHYELEYNNKMTEDADTDIGTIELFGKS